MVQKPINKLVPLFIESLEEKGRSPATILAYRADLEQLSEYLVSKSKPTLEQVVEADLESFRDHLLAEKYTPKSASRKLNAIKTFFRWAKKEGHVDRDPSEDVSHPKIEPSVPKFLSKLEYRALRDVVRDDSRIAAIVELILQTGMRISEVANIKMQNIADDEIIIEAYATQPRRVIPLNKAAKDAVDQYVKNERPESESPYVFISKNGKPLAVRNIRAAIDRYMEKTNISGYSVNDLRTTFIVENLKSEVDIVLISQVVGHKRLSTTERYLEIAQVEDPGKKQTLEEL